MVTCLPVDWTAESEHRWMLKMMERQLALDSRICFVSHPLCRSAGEDGAGGD
jgi:hypothetical protein